jgi:hypothetical protein
MRKNIGLVAVAVTLLVVFQAPAYAAWNNGLTANGITGNGLTQNGIMTNGITGNGLTMNGLIPNGLSGNGQGSQGLSSNGVVAIERDEPLSPTAIVIELPLPVTTAH